MKGILHSRGRLLASAGLALVTTALSAAPAFAQQTDSSATPVVGTATASDTTTDTAAQDIVVTGSLIRRPNLESSSPITAVDSKEFKYQGSTAVEDTLNQLPQFTPDANSNVSNGSDGTANINLRDLGSNRVLILLNGKRLLPTQAVDLNFVPTFLVDRVDVLTGGASAVYGADAVSGVVNFVLKDDLNGVRVNSTYSFFQHNNSDTSLRNLISSSGYDNAPKSVADGGTYEIGAAIGTNFADDRGNVTFFMGNRHSNPILESSRDVSACALNPGDAANSTLSCGGSSNNQYGLFTLLTGPNKGMTLNNMKDGSKTWVPYDSSFAYNYAPTNYFQRSDNRYTAGAFAHYDLSDMFTLYGSFMFMDDHTWSQVAPSAIWQGTTFTINCDNPLMSAQQANLLCGSSAGTSQTENVFIGYRPTSPGSAPRRDDLRHTDYRFTVGLKGEIAPGFTYDFSALRSAVIFDESYKNDIDQNNAANGLQVVNVDGTPTCEAVISGTDPNCVPVDVFGYGTISDAGYSYLYVPSYTHGVNRELVLNSTVNGDLTSYGVVSPWATQGLAFAVGAEHRDEYLDFQADTVAQSKGTSDAHGTINVTEVFTELDLPIIQDMPFAYRLGIDGGFRYSRYTNKGVGDQQSEYKTSTYKAEIAYAPVRDIRFRASYNRAVRSPNISELFGTQGLGNVSADDPCAGSDPVASLSACEASGVTAAQYGSIPQCPADVCVSQYGGNPDVKPEKADTYTIGAVFTPSFAPSLSLSVDYYSIKVKDYISSIDAALTISQCIQSGNPFFCDLFHRDPNSGVLFGTDGYVVGTTQNTGYLKTDGIDFNGNYTFDLSGLGMSNAGKLNFSLVGTYLAHQITEPLPGLGTYDCAGLYGPTCGQPSPHWRHSLRTTWEMPWSHATLSLNWRYKGPVDLTNNQSNPFLSGTTFVYGARIKAYSYFDLAGTVNVMKHFTLRAGINNIFDKDPPALYTAVLSSFGNGNTFPGVYDPLGRKIFVSLTADF
ncbi:TonB-dependent receptor [Stakelama sediminis]|uniref:Outer membrane receptor protein involved in Fe transport n=1 Tax=Stakelama sediminis TaxID=463200 RepID=A0A840YXI4_9SPHN|nr:TonB-dependent receptor [Stakelama sediminis]MBB5718451.1 outer membrane receptor protein involved in Fe transport [Stakelama sediminis]